MQVAERLWLAGCELSSDRFELASSRFLVFPASADVSPSRPTSVFTFSVQDADAAASFFAD